MTWTSRRWHRWADRVGHLLGCALWVAFYCHVWHMAAALANVGCCRKAEEDSHDQGATDRCLERRSLSCVQARPIKRMHHCADSSLLLCAGQRPRHPCRTTRGPLLDRRSQLWRCGRCGDSPQTGVVGPRRGAAHHHGHAQARAGETKLAGGLGSQVEKVQISALHAWLRPPLWICCSSASQPNAL